MITIEQVKDKRNLRFTATINGKCYNCRQNGKVKTWKREPNRFKIPVKYGLYEYFYIDNDNADDWSIL